MALRADVSQDSNEERGRVSLPEKLPSAWLAKLQEETSPLGQPPVLSLKAGSPATAKESQDPSFPTWGLPPDRREGVLPLPREGPLPEERAAPLPGAPPQSLEHGTSPLQSSLIGIDPKEKRGTSTTHCSPICGASLEGDNG